MEYVVLGWPPDAPTLRLDYRRFAYAGKFVTSDTGKAVVRADDAAGAAERGEDESVGGRGEAEPIGGGEEDEYDRGVLAAVSFSPDRTREGLLWLRYVAVRDDRRGEGLGPRLCRFATDRASERGYDRVRIAVNNPFAYHALYKAGFAWTGQQAGLAELVLERGGDRARECYQAGLDVFRDRELSDAETSFLAAAADADPPDVVPVPE